MDINTILKHYLICALWSSIDGNGENFDSFDIDDFHHGAVIQSKDDILGFIELSKGLFVGLNDEQIGHDFWLTRNGHGAGFWDRGLKYGTELTDNANSFGGVDVFSDAGILYIE